MRKCRNCKEPFTPKYNTIQPVCSPKCAIEYSKRQDEKKDKARTREQKEQLKTKSDYEKALERIVNECVRILDAAKPCISCGGNGKPQAGHYHSVGASPSLRYHFDNIHIQCYRCNVHLSSNTIGYDHGLAVRYGIKYARYVKTGLKAEEKPLNLTKIDLKELIKKAGQLRKKIMAGWIKTRDEANLFMGIYK